MAQPGASRRRTTRASRPFSVSQPPRRSLGGRQSSSSASGWRGHPPRSPLWRATLHSPRRSSQAVSAAPGTLSAHLGARSSLTQARAWRLQVLHHQGSQDLLSIPAASPHTKRPPVLFLSFVLVDRTFLGATLRSPPVVLGRSALPPGTLSVLPEAGSRPVRARASNPVPGFCP
ncbi:hypothetical protein NDU88_001783 [Pleurodeles waltl]|uniref:Uncharacterized protein n=1 Tax=Pleurodeles waltl TaxID=8319 RepID=A0AAV7QAV1_PLEWA|nr:hypothetical protein NDU88_001783 [Pleurodeles waltl]